MTTRILTLTLAGALCSIGADLRFHAAEGGVFHFHTGVLKGTLRKEGRSFGLGPVTHLESGSELARSAGLFSVYRVFSDGRRYGNGMWDWPSEAHPTGDGAVAVRWPAVADRPFEMRAVYRWSGPASLELDLSVRPEDEMRGFEAFLASYLGNTFTESAVSTKDGRFTAAEQANGLWQMFPRDRAAAAWIGDGRWQIPPHPVDWAVQREFERPVAFRRDPATGLTIAIMAPAADCFAIATPHQTETHYSLYLSLFGRDLKKGETARVRAQLVVLSSAQEKEIRELYRGFAR